MTLTTLQYTLLRVLGRHIRYPDDEKLSERDLIKTLYKRFLKAFDEPIIDVNE